MTSRPITIACFAFLTLLTGCTGKVRYPDYYMLALAPSKQPATNDPGQLATVAVRRFDTPGYLRQGRIMYRETPEQLGFYEYHRWASEPGQAVTSAVIDALRTTGLFASVEPYDGQERPEYLLRGRLERLDEVDYEGKVGVEVKFSAELSNIRTGAPLWAGSVTKTLDVNTKDMNSVVSAMSQATQDGISQLMTDMEHQLRKSTVASGTSTPAISRARE